LTTTEEIGNNTFKMKYKITFNDEIEAETLEDAFDQLLDYLKDCVNMEDVTAFTFTDENGEEH
jgi:hypothetical protein